MLNGIDSALLRFALTHQDGGPLEDRPLTRNPADYEWLKQALNSIETDFDRMQRIVKVLQDSNHPETKVKDSEIAFSLEELQYLIEDIDNANDFCKIENGLSSVLQNVKHPSFEIRKWAVHVVCTLVQNNPRAQKFAFEQGTFQILIPLLQSESNPEVQSKIISAVSALIRHFPDAEIAFIEGGGLNLLGKFLLDTENKSNCTMKTVFLLTLLLSNHPKFISNFKQLKLDESLFKLDKSISSSESFLDLKEKIDNLNQVLINAKNFK